MPFDLENLGEKVLKGFDDLVRVYAVELSPGVSIPAPQQDGKSALPPISPKLLAGFIIVLLAIGAGSYYGSKSHLPLEITTTPKPIDNPLDKPSIAVLPFTNMSGDPEQEYFVDGMTEDLITDLSKLSGMLVIARNSVFTYKGKAVKIQQVAEELGVRYVLEGSVRRVDDNVRFNAQLIDAETGVHIWADRYDGTLNDVFSLQDKITRKIVSELSVNLSPTEEKLQAIQYTDNAQAYDTFLKGWNLETFGSPEEFNLKVEHFKKATQLDPDYSHAFAALADLYSTVWIQGRTKPLGLPSHEVLQLAYEYTDLAMENPTPLAHRVNARMLANKGKWDEAITEVGIAIALNPNDSIGYRAMYGLLINMGRPAEARLYLNEASRLNPQEDNSLQYAIIQFHSEQYDEAVETLLQHIENKSDNIWQYLYLAASYGHLNRDAEGKAAINKFDELRARQGLTKSYRASRLYYWAFKDDATRDRIRLGLLKAGMPL